jgi:hypothetical protein
MAYLFDTLAYSRQSLTGKSPGHFEEISAVRFSGEIELVTMALRSAMWEGFAGLPTFHKSSLGCGVYGTCAMAYHKIVGTLTTIRLCAVLYITSILDVGCGWL